MEHQKFYLYFFHEHFLKFIQKFIMNSFRNLDGIYTRNSTSEIRDASVRFLLEIDAEIVPAIYLATSQGLFLGCFQKLLDFQCKNYYTSFFFKFFYIFLMDCCRNASTISSSFSTRNPSNNSLWNSFKHFSQEFFRSCFLDSSKMFFYKSFWDLILPKWCQKFINAFFLEFLYEFHRKLLEYFQDIFL